MQTLSPVVACVFCKSRRGHDCLAGPQPVPILTRSAKKNCPLDLMDQISQCSRCGSFKHPDDRCPIPEGLTPARAAFDAKNNVGGCGC